MPWRQHTSIHGCGANSVLVAKQHGRSPAVVALPNCAHDGAPCPGLNFRSSHHHARHNCHYCRLAQTSLERVLGTIIGGVTGLAVYWLSTPVATEWEWALYSVTAGLFGWTAVWLGHKFSLNYSFKLAVITFLLVFAGAENMVQLPPLALHSHQRPQSPAIAGRVHTPHAFQVQEEAKAITVARTAGIVAGVLLTLALAVTVYPVSAHYQHEAHLSHALDALLALHALCWVPLTFAHAPPPCPAPGAAAAPPTERSVAGSEGHSMRSAWEAATHGDRGWGGVNTGFVKRPEFEGAAYGVDRLRVGEDDEVKGAEETVVEVRPRPPQCPADMREHALPVPLHAV